ncbi:MAG: Ig-like domain-containing protein [Gemmatimonadota bacterium]
MDRTPPAVRLALSALVFLTLLAAPTFARDAHAQERTVRLTAEPSRVQLVVGEDAPLTVTAVGPDGESADVAVRFAAPRRALQVRDGRVHGLAVGSWEVVATAAVEPDANGEVPSVIVPVVVDWPAVTRVTVDGEGRSLYAGTTLEHRAAAFHADGTRRPEVDVTWSVSDPRIATVDRFGAVTALQEGSVTVTATVQGVSEDMSYRVLPFPAAQLEIEGGTAEARTGDVLRFSARGVAAGGGEVEALPVTWAYTFQPDDSIQAPGAAAIIDDGAFVAEVPGRYTVLAMSGPLSARAAVRVTPREVVRRVEFQGQGRVSDVHTSDLWVFEGVDGRDYAVTGTWGADGWAHFWDVTDPTNPVRTDSIRVDARTVNDVKVSPDGRYAALSREGASSRRNGVVILDLADPAHPTIASTFDGNGVTGGVHNMFATNDHLFALAGGDKYVILDVTDIRNPWFVSEYNHPDSRVHDVWVHDGIAYSSEWENGVVVVDVGNGRWGGTIENPVFVTNVPYPVGRTHAAFPYVQESTGKVYLFLGDEILTREGAAFEGFGGDAAYDPATGTGGVQSPSSGYIHIIDFTDPENPKDVARYEIPEAGTHNMWIEDDVLYQAYYEGGLRLVDISGELMGNLATQGREIAVFKPFDPQGFMANQPNVWGAQPHKGHVFFSDFNSGLWSVRVQPPSRPIS